MLKKIIAFIICFSLIQLPCYALPLSSEASIVICTDTNQVLFGEDIHKKMGMASTTKIMTAILALEYGNLSDIVTVSKKASLQEGSSIYLKENDKISLCHLLYGLMLNSGNDAAMTIAEHISKSEEDFVLLMNKKAKELGLLDTHFENPSGLPDKNHYSTAYDMAILMSYAIRNEEFAKIVSTKEYKIETQNSVTHLRNHNKLLWKYPFTSGGKTGFTKSCGRCFVSSAKKDGVTLVAVTLNAPDDWNDHMKLFDYGFEKAKMTEIIEKNQILATRKIGDLRINILASNSVFLPLKNGRKHPVSCKIRLDDNIPPIIRFGTHLGYGDIYVDKSYAGSVELISGQDFSYTKTEAFYDTLKNIAKKMMFTN